MVRMLAGLIVVVTHIVLFTAQPRGQSQDAFVFRGATELVVLPVTVTDDDDRFVQGLPQDQFAVFDNGRPQPIQLFTNDDTPVSVALVVDSSGSMQARMGEVTAAAVSFARWSHPEDELFVIAFNDAARDATAGRTIAANDHVTLASTLRTLRPEGRTALYDGLLTALDRLEAARHARKVMVVLSDGGDNASRGTLDRVIERTRHGNVTVYTIGLFGANGRDANPGLLKRLATSTGGERFMPRSPGPMLQACERIARAIRTGYTVGFAPPQRDGSFHRVRVQITGPDAKDMNVRTRPGYFAAREVETLTPTVER